MELAMSLSGQDEMIRCCYILVVFFACFGITINGISLYEQLKAYGMWVRECVPTVVYLAFCVIMFVYSLYKLWAMWE